MDSDATELKSVFDLCSPDEQGFIVTEYLADKLAEQFSDQALISIQDALDPHQIGRISFHQFCSAITKLQSKALVEQSYQNDCFDDNDSSDPENTFNEYDIPEDEISEMENLEAMGESPHMLSPIKTPDSIDYFHQHGSMRRSHHRTRSWTPKQPLDEQGLCDTSYEEALSASSDYEDLSEKVEKLQGHVSRLEEEKTLQTQYDAVKQENHQLTNQINELEEKLQDVTDRCEEMKVVSKHKLEDVQREHNLELQVLQSRIDVLLADKEKLKSELSYTKTDARETREALANLQAQSELLTNQIMETNEEYRRLNKRFTTQQNKHECECAQLREEFNKVKARLDFSEEENNKLKLDLVDTRFDPSAARMKAHVDNLKAENDELKRNNEELTDQLAQNLTEARLLMCNGDQSIAQELSSASRDEVMDALKKQEAINDQLRDYLDRITLNILERDPSILEIK